MRSLPRVLWAAMALTSSSLLAWPTIPQIEQIDAAERDREEWMGLVEGSRKARPACEKYDLDMMATKPAGSRVKTMEGWKVEVTTILHSKKDFDAILNLWPKWPAAASSAGFAIRWLLDHPKSFQKEDLQSVHNIYKCPPSPFLDGGSLLIRSIDAVGLSAKEKNKALGVIVELLKSDNRPKYGVPALRANMALVELLLSKKLLSLSDPLYINLLDLKERVKDLERGSRSLDLIPFDEWKSFKDWPASLKEERWKMALRELSEGEKIIDRLGYLLSRAHY